MKSTDFVYALREKLLKKAIENYALTYNKKYENTTDNYISAIQVYQSLSEEEQKQMFYLIETVISDTIADLLGWLDGQNYFESQLNNPVLSFEGTENNINGHLQDIWFNLEEGMTKREIDVEFD